MKSLHYLNLKYRPKPNDLVCRFKVIPAKGYSLAKAAENCALESSIGTWTDIATMNPTVAKRLKPSVYKLNPKKQEVYISYPVELFEQDNMCSILSSIAGNIFGMKAVRGLRLLDIKFPKAVVDCFPGPQFGIQGIRKLTKIKKRPLVGTIVKPKVGLSEAQHAQVAYDAWTGGLDVVKDDENLSSMSFNNFQKRMRATFAKRDKAEDLTGHKKIYMPNITAELNEMLKRAEYVKKMGGEYIMVDILTIGWSALHTLVKAKMGMVFHAHRAGHAMFTRHPDQGMSMLVVAKLCRLLGMDQLHIGTANVGKMEGSADEVVEIEENIEKPLTKENPKGFALGQNWHGLKPILAVASGGLHPGGVPKLIKHMGTDIVAQFGGGCHGHPDGTYAGAKAILQAVEGTLKGVPLRKYAQDHEELGKAVKKWGVV